MNSKSVTILYAEDDEEDRFLFLEGAQFVNESIKIFHVENGKEVLRYLAALDPGEELPLAIVSDLRMPLCDGLELLRIVKQNIRWKQIPVILFSTSSSHADISLATQLGVRAYFTKPGTYKEFIEIVDRILNLCSEQQCSRQSLLP